MAQTVNYSFNLPTVNGDADAWGDLLNANFTALDDMFSGASPVTGIDIDGGEIDGVVVGENTPLPSLRVGNIRVAGNTLGSTNTNGNIDLVPNGDGDVTISKVDINGGAIDGAAIGATQPSSGRFTSVDIGINSGGDSVLRFFDDTSNVFRLVYWDASTGRLIMQNSDGTAGRIWNSGNDGSGSGMDADTVDGKHADSFVEIGSNDYAQAQTRIANKTWSPISPFSTLNGNGNQVVTGIRTGAGGAVTEVQFGSPQIRRGDGAWVNLG